jgi:hypothetical protein
MYYRNIVSTRSVNIRGLLYKAGVPNIKVLRYTGGNNRGILSNGGK